jgi:hypothetical protein
VAKLVDYLRIYGLGIAKPEYIKREEMTSDPGANACTNVRELAAMDLKTMDMTIVMGNVVETKKKGKHRLPVVLFNVFQKAHSLSTRLPYSNEFQRSSRDLALPARSDNCLHTTRH